MCCMQTGLKLANLTWVFEVVKLSFNTILKRFGAKQFIMLSFATEYNFMASLPTLHGLLFPDKCSSSFWIT